MAKRKFRCSDCRHAWEIAYGAPRPSLCPQCRSANFHRVEEDRRYARRGSRVKGEAGFGEPPMKKEL
jgi:Zn finger protein HypA/HybF involved in hydrogenase expression